MTSCDNRVRSRAYLSGLTTATPKNRVFFGPRRGGGFSKSSSGPVSPLVPPFSFSLMTASSFLAWR